MLTLAFLAPQKIWGMDKPDSVDHHTVRKIVREHLAAHPALLDSSKDKEIVVFLGNTGAGKSTLINYLSGKKLKVNEFEDIVLDNPNDPSAMAIGGGSVSETFLPAFVQAGDLLLYDLPGFKDNRGTAKNLVTAGFIKCVIEKARSAKLVFVAGIDQITSDRGASFKTLQAQAKQLIPNSSKPIETFSSLVITKSHINKAKLPEYLKAKVDVATPGFEIMEFLLEGQMLAQMSKPKNSIIDSQERDDIFKMIATMGQDKIENIDVGVIYDTNQQLEIKKIYDVEIEEVIEKVFSQYVDVQNLPALDKVSLERVRDTMRNNFNSQVYSSLNDSPLIKLLRPLAEGLYVVSWKNKQETLSLRVDKVVSLINTAIKEKEKQEEEKRRIQAELALRQAQERARAEQERAYRAEQELRAYKAQEIRRQQEIQRQQEARKQEEARVQEARRQQEAAAQREAERQRQLKLQEEKEARAKEEERRAEQRRQEEVKNRYQPIKFECSHVWTKSWQAFPNGMFPVVSCAKCGIPQ